MGLSHAEMKALHYNPNKVVNQKIAKTVCARRQREELQEKLRLEKELRDYE